MADKLMPLSRDLLFKLSLIGSYVLAVAVAVTVLAIPWSDQSVWPNTVENELPFLLVMYLSLGWVAFVLVSYVGFGRSALWMWIGAPFVLLAVLRVIHHLLMTAPHPLLPERPHIAAGVAGASELGAVSGKLEILGPVVVKRAGDDPRAAKLAGRKPAEADIAGGDTEGHAEHIVERPGGLA
jgi:hypothetical protein